MNLTFIAMILLERDPMAGESQIQTSVESSLRNGGREETCLWGQAWHTHTHIHPIPRPACLFRRQWGWSGNGRSLSLKRTFCTCLQTTRDVAAIGPWAGQGTA